MSGQKPEVDCTTTFSDPELERASWRLMSEGKRVARGVVELTDTHFELRLDNVVDLKPGRYKFHVQGSRAAPFRIR